MTVFLLGLAGFLVFVFVFVFVLVANGLQAKPAPEPPRWGDVTYPARPEGMPRAYVHFPGGLSDEEYARLTAPADRKFYAADYPVRYARTEDDCIEVVSSSQTGLGHHVDLVFSRAMDVRWDRFRAGKAVD